MCTVSWNSTASSYTVLFSRDEQRTRSLGEPPKIWITESGKFLAPRDPQGGGTWLFVNEHGLTACVLNSYEDPSSPIPAGQASSRGLLLLAMAACRNVAEMYDRLTRLVASGIYRPGFLLAWSRHEVTGLWHWQGHDVDSLGVPPRPMLTTSSYQTRTVYMARVDDYDRQVGISGVEPSPATLRRFHEAGDGPADAYRVRMSRPDARTVSLTELTVGGGEAVMTYRARIGDEEFEPGSVHRMKLHSIPSMIAAHGKER